MNITVLQGRTFTREDNSDAPRRLMINQALAQRDFPTEDPVGKRIPLGNTDATNQSIWLESVAVPANGRSLESREEAPPELYFAASEPKSQNMAMAVRSSPE